MGLHSHKALPDSGSSVMFLLSRVLQFTLSANHILKSCHTNENWMVENYLDTSLDAKLYLKISLNYTGQLQLGFLPHGVLPYPFVTQPFLLWGAPLLLVNLGAELHPYLWSTQEAHTGWPITGRLPASQTSQSESFPESNAQMLDERSPLDTQVE